MTIAITGAAGQLGRLTAQRVLDRVPPGEVVLVTRRPDAIADLADAGAIVRHGDFDEPASLPAAFAGVERMLLISTDVLGNRVAQHTAAIEAAAAAGVGHVIYTSSDNAGSELPLVVSHEHGATEEAIRDRGLRWTALRNGLYAEFQVARRGARRRVGRARAQQRRRRARRTCRARTAPRPRPRCSPPTATRTASTTSRAPSSSRRPARRAGDGDHRPPDRGRRDRRRDGRAGPRPPSACRPSGDAPTRPSARPSAKVVLRRVSTAVQDLTGRAPT